MEAQVIHYLQPYAVDKNIAHAYNKAVELVPDSDWVCITDQDSLWLLPDQKAQVQKVVDSKPPVELFGCMTNRLNVPDQLSLGMFSVNEMQRHIDQAKELQSRNYGQYKETKNTIAGLFMLFRKSDWKRVGGFDEMPEPWHFKFDTFFSQKFDKKAILTGVYLFHLYRWGAENPAKSVEHLI